METLVVSEIELHTSCLQISEERYEMPYYQWKCEKCQMSIDILRHFSEYLDTPTEVEITEASGTEKTTENCSHTWERSINVPAAYRVWPATGGRGKGNW